MIRSDDDWRYSQESLIQSSGREPTNAAEPAMIPSVEPGSYTAIVRGKVAALVSRWSKFTTCSSERARITAVPGGATLPTEL